MPGEILWVLTNDTEFTAGWGKNPADKSTDLVYPDSVRAQLVTRNRGLAGVLAEFALPQTIMLCWGCFLSLEIAAEAARRHGLDGSAWRRAYEEGLALLAELKGRGHALCIHPHYEKDLSCSDPDYRYAAALDALERWSKWSNGYYRYRGSFARAASLTQLGVPGNLESRSGYLCAGREWLSRHLGTVASPAARTGGWDFGFTPQDKALSEQAYLANGLMVNLDADLNLSMWRDVPAPAKPWSESCYLAQPGDINQPSADAGRWGLVEFAHCSASGRTNAWYDLNSQPLEELDRELDAAVSAFSDQGVVKPGVHVIIAMCHSAGFVGEAWDAWRGGDFVKLEAHFQHLRERYVDRGLITPATVEQAAARFLDAHSSRLVAWPAAVNLSDGGWRIPVQLAGGIGVEAAQAVEVHLPPQVLVDWGSARVAVETESGPVPSQRLTGFAPRIRFAVEPRRRAERYQLVSVTSQACSRGGLG